MSLYLTYLLAVTNLTMPNAQAISLVRFLAAVDNPNLTAKQAATGA